MGIIEMILAKPDNGKVLKEFKKEMIKVEFSTPFIPRQEAKYIQARRDIIKLISMKKTRKLRFRK